MQLAGRAVGGDQLRERIKQPDAVGWVCLEASGCQRSNEAAAVLNGGGECPVDVGVAHVVTWMGYGRRDWVRLPVGRMTSCHQQLPHGGA